MSQETPSQSEMNSFMTAFDQIWDAIVATGNPDVTYGQQAMRFVNAILSRALQNHMTHATPGQIRHVVGDISNMLVNGNRNFFPGPISHDNFMHLIGESDRILQRNFSVEDPFYMGRIASGYTQAIINDGQRTSSSSNQQETSNAQMARNLQEQFLRRTERLDAMDARKLHDDDRTRAARERAARERADRERRDRLDDIARRNSQYARQLAANERRHVNARRETRRNRTPSRGESKRSTTPPRGTRRRRRITNRPGSGAGGVISGITGFATTAVQHFNPFPAIWAAFTGCKRKGKGDECKLPGKRSDLPPIEILAGENGFPFLNELIPGTGYTFQQLRDAMAPNSTGAREAGVRSCMAVHRVMSNLTNGELVYQIIDEFARNNPLWAEHSRRATAREIIQLLMDYLTQWTERSEPIYRNPVAIRAVVQAASGAIRDGQMITIGGRQIDSASFALLFIFFIGQMPPPLQKRWAENLIRDSIEAYDYKLETFGENSSGSGISCPKGVIERMFLGLHAELMQARERIIDERAIRIHEEFDEQERIRLAAAAAAALEAQKRRSQKRGKGKGPGSRHKMVEEWTRQHYMDQSAKEKELDAKELRIYLQSKINSNSDYHNTPEEWGESMQDYFTDDMLDGLMIEREGKGWNNISKGGKRRYRKKKTKRSKKRNRKKTRKAGKKK
jgi:hypothetical protein